MVYIKKQQTLSQFNCLDYVLSFLKDNDLSIMIDHPYLFSFPDNSVAININRSHISIGGYWQTEESYLIMKRSRPVWNKSGTIFDFLADPCDRFEREDVLVWDEILIEKKEKPFDIMELDKKIGWDTFCHLAKIPLFKSNLRRMNDLELGMIGKESGVIKFVSDDGFQDGFVTKDVFSNLCFRYGSLFPGDSDGHYTPEVINLNGSQIPVYRYDEWLYLRESPGRVKLFLFLNSGLSNLLGCKCCYDDSYKKKLKFRIEDKFQDQGYVDDLDTFCGMASILYTGQY